MTQTATLELTEHDVRVNAVCPGLIAIPPLAVGKPGVPYRRKTVSHCGIGFRNSTGCVLVRG